MMSNLVIEKHSLAELKELTHKKSKHPIMSLVELLELVNSKVPVLIEIKYSNNKGRELDQAVALILASYKGDVAIQTFDPFSCRWFYKNATCIKRGLLIDKDYEDVERLVTRVFLRYALMLPWCKPDFIALNMSRRKELFIRVLKNISKLPFIAWTVKTKNSSLECAEFFDTIIFDNFDKSFIGHE